MNNFTVKKSKIHKKGVFAANNIKKGEIVLKWKPKILKKSTVEELQNNQKHYIYRKDNKYFLMQPPERYVNHSCDANTKVKNNSDVAMRNIKNGEEITSDYGKIGGSISFKCACHSKKCRGAVKYKVFSK